MLINGIENQTVDFKIVGYEFPSSFDDGYDRNWLRVWLKAKTKLGHWQTIDSSLLTWEVKTIINYFRNLSLSQECKKELSFIEPNISFVLLGDVEDEVKKIKIVFDLESRPQSAKDSIEYFVEFHVNSDELLLLADELEGELNRYPER